MAELTVSPWVIELYGEGLPESLKLRLDDQLVIGRSDKSLETQPDVDLGPHDAENLGVSRRHLMLRAEEDNLYITDLNSGNGTFLNGARLEADKPYLVKYGDDLRLGRMKLGVRIIISPTQGSVTYKQDDLVLGSHEHRGNGEAVLIVEDDVEVANILSLIISRAGYKPYTSHDVIGAIRLFNQRKPVAVLLDLMLPDMNGLEFCRYVRRDVERNSTPVIVVSAVKTRQFVTQAMDAGADMFLGKPVSAQELQQVVTSIIHQHQSGVDSLSTRHLPGTAPLQAIAPDSRQDAVVLFVAGFSDTPITLAVREPVSFGRQAQLPGRKHVDLSRYNAVEQGVSRIHAFLHRQGNHFFIEDADSVNGTFLNGQPLKPNERTRLNNADEIRLGQMRMYIYFLTDKDQQISAPPEA